ncbi:glycine cleavage system protein GcvH [Arhodomonas sp. SL1]|uniref:glycine cleavage system protein GcvH n=1 Tax=Arhodomonas sp. SL1 TaxID=3425691 RepID=UPI003F882B06
MSNVPSELKYTASHEWVRPEEDGSVTVGITDHAQESLGDLVFVELPEPGGVDSEATIAVVESVKAASDIYAPLAGEITEVNERLADEPELINQDPYGEGWLFRMQPADDGAVDGLMDAAAYQGHIAEE